MIKEDFVFYDTAKLLKEAGCPQDLNRPVYCWKEGGVIRFDNFKRGDCYAVMTQAQAMKWLREEQHLSVEICVCSGAVWDVNVWKFGESDLAVVSRFVLMFPSYGEAVESGIQAACRYLIENQQKQ